MLCTESCISTPMEAQPSIRTLAWKGHMWKKTRNLSVPASGDRCHCVLEIGKELPQASGQRLSLLLFGGFVVPLCHCDQSQADHGDNQSHGHVREGHMKPPVHVIDHQHAGPIDCTKGCQNNQWCCVKLAALRESDYYHTNLS